MITSFTEFSTNAQLRIGDESLLEQQESTKQLGLFTLIWSKEKTLNLVIDGQPIQLAANNIVSLTPIQYLEFPENANAIIYQFNREFYCIKDHDKQVSCAGLLFYGNQHVPIVSLDETERRKFDLLHQVFLEEISTTDNVQAEMLRMLMARLVIKITRLLKTTGSTQELYEGKIELLRQYNQLVETHFREEHGVAFYADQLHKSPKTLSNSFLKLDTSPIKIIHERIILEAKRQLKYTDKSAKEIAYDIGFDDASHLSRMFKKVTGISPSAFRLHSIQTA